MGGQMVIHLVYHEAASTIEWDEALKAVDDLELEADERAGLNEDLSSLRLAIVNQTRDIATFEFQRIRFYATGGVSWGDAPTDLGEAIERLGEHTDVLAAAGLKQVL